MASAVNPYPTRGGELITINTTQRTISTATTIYTATENCTIYLALDMYQVYLKINGIASTSNFDIQLNGGYPSINKISFAIERQMMSGNKENSSVGYLQLNLNKGDYLNLLAGNNSRATLYGYSVFSR